MSLNKSGGGALWEVKTHTSPEVISKKVGLRSGILEAFAERSTPAHVFDAFCGPTGEMFDRVWFKATSYVGCDQEIVWPDHRRRFVGDNRRIMRAIDLAAWNVFDLDAFGSPWEQMVILSVRRPWSSGELGAVILTDGSHGRTQLGGSPRALGHLCGLRHLCGLPTGQRTGEALQAIALDAWVQRSRVRVLKQRRFERLGGMRMAYSSVFFEGLGPAI